MQIENPESLKNWLASNLENLCDASPISLSKYIIALLKKDRHIEDVKANCAAQLEIFLGSETADFVEELFRVLRDRSYLAEMPVTQKEVTKSAETHVLDDEDRDFRRLRQRPEPDSPSHLLPDVYRKRRTEDLRGGTERELKASRRDPDSSRRITTTDHEAAAAHDLAESSDMRSDDRPGLDSRDKYSDRQSHRRSMDLRSKLNRDKRSREKCRDYIVKGFCLRGNNCHYDHGLDPLEINNMYLNGVFGFPPVFPPMLRPPGLQTPFMPYPIRFPPHFTPAPAMALNTIRMLNSRPISSVCEVPSEVMSAGRQGGYKDSSGPEPSDSVGYNPEDPAMDRSIPLHAYVKRPIASCSSSDPPRGQSKYLVEVSVSSRGPSESMPQQNEPSAPVPVPTTDSACKETQEITVPPNSGRPFVHNTTLEVRKIPPEQNNISRHSEFFQRFGKVINIQINYDNDPQAALVQFSCNREARRAYQCPDAVLGNRFIKLFWHSPGSGPKPPPPQSNTQTSQSAPAQTPPGTQAPATTVPVSTRPRLPLASELSYVRPVQQSDIARKAKSESEISLPKMRLDLLKRQWQFLDDLTKEQEKLLDLFEQGNLSNSERESVKQKLKSLHDQSATLNAAIEECMRLVKPKQTRPGSKTQSVSEVYPWSSINQSSGLQTSIGQDSGPETRSFGVAGVAPGQQQQPRPPAASLDRSQRESKAKELLVMIPSGVTFDSLVDHFSAASTVDSAVLMDGKFILFSFSSSKMADQAVAKAGQYNNQRLVMRWFQRGVAPHATSTSLHNTRKLDRVQGQGVNQETDPSEETVLWGEEEEECVEGRPWRR